MNITERYSGIQSLMRILGDEGCHFLTLLSIAEQESNQKIDLIDAVHLAIKKSWMDTEFTVTVKGSLELLKHYTGKTWTRREVNSVPDFIKDNEYTELIYKNDNTGFRHYRRRIFDTLVNSITVRDGYIEKVYIYTCEA